MRVTDDRCRLQLRDAPLELVVEAFLPDQLLLDSLKPGLELSDPFREVFDVALLAVMRVVPEFLDVVEQRLDEADGRLTPLLVKLIKRVASKQCRVPPQRKETMAGEGRKSA
jgi:hypothetical protein